MQTPASAAAPDDQEPFAGSPITSLLQRLRVGGVSGPRAHWRVLLAIAAAWAPLAALTMIEGRFIGSRDEHSFLSDIAVHARFLIALPGFVVAESMLAMQLREIIQHFVVAGIITNGNRARFDAAVNAAGRAVRSRPVEIAIFALTYALLAAAISSLEFEELPGWNRSGGEVLSPAGWWHVLVSLPLLLVAIFGLLWRWLLWVLLLWRISSMRLALVPAHPDLAAGLGFVSHSVRAFAVYGLLLSVIVAGSVANKVAYENVSPTEYAHEVGALIALIVVLFSAPLLAFTRTLLDTWRRGVLAYDALADRIGRQFEERWLGGGDADRDALGSPDFSAVADLFSVASNVRRMRVLPCDLKSILVLAGAAAAPFLPVMLLAVPFDELVARILGVLL